MQSKKLQTIVLYFVALTIVVTVLNISGCKKSDESPVVRIDAVDTLYADFGVPFALPPLVAFDREDHDLSDFVTVSDNLDVNRLGTYEVVFSVTDSDGNVGSDSRVVIILPKPVALVGSYRSQNNCPGCAQSGLVSIQIFQSGTSIQDRIRISPSFYGQIADNEMVLQRNGLDYFRYGSTNDIICTNISNTYDIYYSIATINPTCDSISMDLKLYNIFSREISYCSALYVRE